MYVCLCVQAKEQLGGCSLDPVHLFLRQGLSLWPRTLQEGQADSSEDQGPAYYPLRSTWITMCYYRQLLHMGA